ncbi:MAG: alpha/beta hydrolase-fold protein, partial [Candidatus Aminicenantaceae bacterium]
LRSRILNEERTLLIHLPKDYAQKSAKYPVLYLLYGDHVTTYFGETVAILDRLGQTGRIPEMLLMAVTNTDRYRDLLPEKPDGTASGIHNFMRFFEEELVPFVESQYRTKPFRVIVGPQAGAGFAMYTLFEKPGLFQAAIINHPFRWRGGRDKIIQSAERYFAQQDAYKKFLYVSYEDSDELAREGIPYIDRFAALVKEKDIQDFEFHLNFIPNNDEFITPMGLRTGMKSLFSAYPFPEDKEISGLEDIQNHYADLSKKYGFTIDIPDQVLAFQSDRLQQQGKRSVSLEVLDFMLKLYPDSANAHWRLASVRMQEGELEAARDHFAKVLENVGGDNAMIRERLNQIERRIEASSAYAVARKIQEKGLSSGIELFRELRAADSGKYYFQESEFNELGYRFLAEKKMKDAIEIFKLNIEMFLDSANAFDSLAEAYMTDGQTNLAIKYYQKSLQLNPENRNARDMLAKLKKKQQAVSHIICGR